jgi:ketosteroid isomerase-like protein
MSQENVKVVRAQLQAWNEGDMDALRERYDPDAMIVRGLEDWPEQERPVGRDAVIRYFKQLRETWDADTMEPTSEFIDVGDRVAVRVLWSGEGQGPEMRMEFTIVYTLRESRTFYQEHFWDHAEALKTLGLSE